MRRIQTCLLLAAALLLHAGQRISMAADPPAEPAYVTLADMQYEIDNLSADDEYKVRLALKLKPGIKAVEPTLVDVALGQRHDQSLKQAFIVTREKAEEGAPPMPPAFIITVKTKELEQGTYNLRIEVRPAAPAQNGTPPPQSKTKTVAAAKGADAEMRAQLLNVVLTLPAATLRAPGTPVFEQVWPLFGLWGGDPQELALMEDSGKRTRLTNVNVAQAYPAEGANNAAKSKATFEPFGQIAPGHTERAAVTLSDTFPLGTTKGAGLITSPQLAKPVAFNFEVRARRSGATIIVAIILGLLMGFVTRIFAARRIELFEARQKALVVANALARELGKVEGVEGRQDEVFRQMVAEPLARLRAAIQSGSAAAVNESATAANAALTAALADLDARRAVARQDLQTLQRLSGNTALLPPELVTAFTVEAGELANVSRLIALDNIAAAQQALDAEVERLGRGLNPVISTWRGNSESFLEQVKALADVLPTSASASIDDKVSAINKSLDELKLPDESTTIEQLASLSGSLRDARTQVGELILRVRGLLTGSAQTLKAQFEQVFNPVPDSIKEVIVKLEQIRQGLLSEADHPEAGEQELLGRVVDVKGVWQEALLSLITGGDESVVDAVQALLDEDRYLDASFKVVQLLRTNKDTLLGEEGTKPEASAVPSFAAGESLAELLGGGANAAEHTVLHIVSERTLLPALDLLELRNWRDLVLASGIRFIIAAALILAIGYALFVDKFVGTFSDLLAIFVWAFGLNISVDAVLETGKKLKIGN